MGEVRTIDAFLLTREWRDASDGIEIVLWARAAGVPVRVQLSGQEAVLFVPRGAPTRGGRQVARPLRTLQGGDPVDAVYFRSQRALVEERHRLAGARIRTFEADVKPADRFLMERFVTGGLRIEGPAEERGGVLRFDRGARVTGADVRLDLSILALDIETDGYDGPLLSAAIAGGGRELVLVRGRRPAAWPPDAHPEIVFVADERALLARLFAAITEADPDVVAGWNVVDFDLTRLERRARQLGVPFSIGRGGERARILPASSPGRSGLARVPGRVVLDGIATLRAATYTFERYGLDHVARELLGRGKRIAPTADPVAEIRRMHAEEPDRLADYNLEDCRLVLEVFARAHLLGFAMERARLTGLAMDRQGGSVAAFDHLYLPRLHRRGFVAPDVDVDVEPEASPGGHVLDSVPGLYTNVLAFDFRSLYPSIIRTFQIDPLGLAQPGDDPIPGEDGARFAREGAILPELIGALHEARSAAIATDQPALSRAIKILMNSFYGVLGTPGCRFFDPRLPTSITRRGHAVIERARASFEERGLPVLYGDTDSLFVHAGEGEPDDALASRGRALAAEVTRTLAEEIAAEHRLTSHLELRFDAHHLRFLMPTTRGAERGSKKRYAGLVRTADGGTRLVVRGLEAVRRDWTPLARRVQLELLRRVFAGEPFEAWLLQIAADLRAGRLDAELVVRRRLRDDDEIGAVDTVVTTRGVQPVAERTAPIDHEHHVTRQLAPVCDVVLPFLGTSFDRVAGRQTRLF